MNSMVKVRRVVAAAAFGVMVAMSGAANAEGLANQDLAVELRIAESLERAIRDSEKLGLFTKLDIKNRFDEVRTVTKDFKRGAIAEYDLKEVFISSIVWLERVFAKRDPALQIQLAEARAALWKIAVSQ